MNLLLNQGLPRSTVQELAAIGLSSEHVGNIGLAAAADEVILEEARVRRAVVVTLDADFHSILARTSALTLSVIRIRIEGLKAPSLAALLQCVVQVAAIDLAAGAAISITPPDLVRVRRLPLA